MAFSRNNKGGLYYFILLFASASSSSLDGGWSPWSKLETPCQKSETDTSTVFCGGGVRIRYRSCTMPVPHGPDAKPCQGSDVKYEPCNAHSCLLPEEFMWSSWSICSKNCGRGITKRHTMCGVVRSKYGPQNDDDEVEGSEETTTTDDIMSEETTTFISTNGGGDTSSKRELAYEERCQSNQFKEEIKLCNTWDKNLCPSPCDRVKCPAFAKCQDVSNDTDPIYECVCQLGTVKKADGSSCIAPTPQPITQRPYPSLPPSQKTTVTVITRSASGLLIAFLIVTLVLFAVARVWDHARVIHFNMELALLLAHLCLLPSGVYDYSEEGCRLISILIHFFFLACFTFMFLEALHLYALVGWVVKSGSLMSKGLNVFMGWMVPLVILLFNLCFEYENYGGGYHCWLRMDTSLIYGQFVPIAFVAIISLAIVEAAGDASDYKKLEKVDEAERKTATIMQRTLVLILPTVFASFLLGSLAEYDQNLILYSIFTIINGFLGGMIFFFHTAANEKVRAKVTGLKTKLCGNKRK